MPRDFPSRHAILNAQGYEHISAIRRCLTKIEDELAGDRNEVIIGAMCEVICEELAHIWSRDIPKEFETIEHSEIPLRDKPDENN